MCWGQKPIFPTERNNDVLYNKFNKIFSNKIENIVQDVDITVENESLSLSTNYEADASLSSFNGFNPFSPDH